MMRRLCCFSLALLLPACSQKPLEQQSGQGSTKTEESQATSAVISVETRAKAFIGSLAKSDFATAVKDFDTTMQQALSVGKLAETWHTLEQQAGAFKTQKGVRTEPSGVYQAVFVTCDFERTPLDAKIVFNANKQISGLFFVPSRPAKADKTSSANKGSTLELKTPTGTLFGTLDLPADKGPFPAVVLIAGSGPTDRDGNQLGMQNDSLKMLGLGLAQKGVAVLRYDKRGVGESTPAAIREQDLRLETFADDAAGWVDFLRKDARFSRVGIVGHSEGSLIGMLAANQTRVDAMVSIAGSGRPAQELIRIQLAARPASPLAGGREKSDHIINELIAGRMVGDVPAEFNSLFRPSVQPYLISWFRHDPAKDIATLAIPVLIVQGTTDIQVQVEDAQRLSKAKKDAELCLIEGMNHVLKHVSTFADQDKAYRDASVALDPRVTDKVATFITSRMR